MDVTFWKFTLPRLLLVAFLAGPLPCFGGLLFDGSKQYVTFGTATNLGTETMTLELWFNWSGHGRAANTGSGGVAAIPLIAKLTSESDGSKKDGNYFLGIETAHGVLAGDMEEGAKGAKPGQNHALIGQSSITSNTWHHAAMTYDGTNCVLFLDGRLDAALAVKQPPRADSLQHAALGTTLDTTGKPEGYFAGILDQVRIWNYARSPSQILQNMRKQIDSAPGLLGCWALDQTSGETAFDTSGGGTNGKLVKGPRWKNDYRMTNDVVAPIKLAVIDPIRTATLRAKEASRVPAVFLYDSNSVVQVRSRFQTSFLLTKEKFMAAMHEAFPSQAMTEELTTTPAFASEVARFREENKDFPLNLPLATEWVMSRSSDRLRSALASGLEKYMSRYIRPSGLPDGVGKGSGYVSVIAWDLNGARPSIDVVEERSRRVLPTDLRSIRHASTDLARLLGKEHEPLAPYLALFVTVNTLFEPDLTRQRRARQSADLFALDHYEPGDLIARKGQIIDEKITAALDELEHGLAGDAVKARAEAKEIQSQAELRESEATKAMRALQEEAERSAFKSNLFDQMNHWLLGILAAAGAISAFTIWRLTRLKRLRALVPVPAHWHGGGVIPTEPTTQVIVEGVDGPQPELAPEEWKERALLAEKREAQSTEIVRAGLIPHLAHWFRDRLFRKALSDRAQLLETQRKAEQDVVQLEKRLEELHAPLHERLNAYEGRIAELETQLEVKGAENRELIRAKIEMTRSRLAAAKGDQGLSTATERD